LAIEDASQSANSQDARRAALVRRLLTGDLQADPDRLPYEFDAEHIGLIARGPDAQNLMEDLAATLCCGLLTVAPNSATAWGWLGTKHGFGVVELEQALSVRTSPAAASLAVGEPARGLPGWRLTHHQARHALRVAVRRPQKLTRYSDVALVAAALKDRGLGRALVGRYIAPLQTARIGTEVLRDTLRVYLELGGNISSAAASLGTARKTVESRLRVIEECIGCSLRPCPPEVVVALHLAELGLPGLSKSR
jgi:hypothetical protein